MARTRRIEAGNRGAAYELRHDAGHAGICELAVPEVGHYQAEAMAEAASGLRGVSRRRDRVVAAREEQRRYRGVQRLVEVGVHRASRPDAADRLQSIEL